MVNWRRKKPLREVQERQATESGFARDHGITNDDWQCRRVEGHPLHDGTGHIFVTDNVGWGYLMGFQRCPAQAQSAHDIIRIEG